MPKRNSPSSTGPRKSNRRTSQPKDSPRRNSSSESEKRKPFKKRSTSEDNSFSSPTKRITRNKEEASDQKGSERKTTKNFSEGKGLPARKKFSKGPSKPYDKDAKPRYKKRSDVEEIPDQPEKIRLNKFIANGGVCSRREADNLISMGLITVNGKVITELGYKVNLGDVVRYEDKLLKSEKLVYILMNKPKGYITTTRDPQERNTVMQIIGSTVRERIYPVGRLDRNTTGLLLLTNDGDLAEKLSHPSYETKKIYKVELDRPLTKGDFQKIQEGVVLEEGRAMVDDVAIVSSDNKTVGLELHIGWNRVVRRIFETLGYEVMKLDRSVYAGLDKKDLPRGQWRFLTKEEVVRLKHFKSSHKN